MKILLLGKDGQIGWELSRTLVAFGQLVALGREELDLAQFDRIPDVVRTVRPQLLINAAAYTDVDKAETDRDLAEAVNAVAPGILAEEAARLGSVLIHYSTDYVFDGSKGSPYVEGDTPNPLNFYGHSKLAGEKAIMAVTNPYLILRTSWVYSFRRPCFVTKFRRWVGERNLIRIATDQVSSPTWARTVAEFTAQILSHGRENPREFAEANAGVYHLAASGAASRFEWAEAILSELHGDSSSDKIQLVPAKSSDFDSAARRPRYSVLDCTALRRRFSIHLPDWKVGLASAFSGASRASVGDHSRQ